MKQILKPMLLTAVVAIVGLFTGCSSSLDPNTFTTEVGMEDTSNFWSGNSASSILTIRSNSADKIQVTNVKINNGQCGYKDRYNSEIKFPQHFKMGNVLKVYLKCGYSNVVQVDVETDQGTASYSFQ